MVDSIALTFVAIYLTLIGQVPLEIWLPLFEDIISNVIACISGIFTGIII